LSKNITSYFFSQNKKIFVLVISQTKGWGIILYKKPCFLYKNNKVFFYLTCIKSSLTFFSTLFFGFQKGYFKYLILKGMNYKFTTSYNNIILKLGFSHRILFINFIDTKCRLITKYFLKLESRSLLSLKKTIQLFIIIRKKNSYIKKGIFLKGSLIKIKSSSKKSKF
jgi:ribosomal protein L6P/L9E